MLVSSSESTCCRSQPIGDRSEPVTSPVVLWLVAEARGGAVMPFRRNRSVATFIRIFTSVIYGLAVAIVPFCQCRRRYISPAFLALTKKLSGRCQTRNASVQMQCRGWPPKDTPLPIYFTIHNFVDVLRGVGINTGEPWKLGALELRSFEVGGVHCGKNCGCHKPHHMWPPLRATPLWPIIATHGVSFE